MRLQLTRTALASGQAQTSVLETPIALGREFALMPGILEGNRVSRLVLEDAQVADYHALIDEQAGELVIIDQSGGRGLRVNGVSTTTSPLQDGDHFQIGSYDLQVQFNPEAPVASDEASASAFNSAGECDRKVGFLFPRRCGRTTTVDCPYCNSDQANNDPYFYERSYYSGYGTYHSGYWGSNYYENRNSYSYNSETRNIDFTDADSASFEQEADTDFEQDMGAS
uniref:FHA domain-containing protein n=1 Tax=Trichocoleus desertorum TaxID=1481672 RepID=UPI0025B5682F|nr:FHA domain-containing protein [Trichocoleus desertorum]